MQKENFSKKMPFCGVLDNLRSLYNVGSIFRTADGVGLEKLWLCGITGIPPDPKISKTALGAEVCVPWEFSASTLECLKQLKAQGYQLVALEECETAVGYETFVPSWPVALVVGSETSGIAPSILEFCDVVLRIDMAGLKQSLNAAVAFGVVSFHFRYLYRSLVLKKHPSFQA